ncbi:MAG: SGNH/GDSL hydrolase family protein [Pseudomonadota bacterium]
MASSARLALIAGALAAFATAGCDGQRIHLGDGVCPHARVPADQMLWIGDSWVTIPGNQVTGVEQAARAAGAIGPTDAYTNRAANGTLMAQIAAEYTAQEATATRAQVVVMDGGTLDTIMNDSPATVANVASTFQNLLAAIATDGTVTSIIYFLVPELPAIAGVAALRPVLQQACAASTVPCTFLDLQPIWSDAYTNTASGGIFPNDTGGQVIADAIWKIMQSQCIAQ